MESGLAQTVPDTEGDSDATTEAISEVPSDEEHRQSGRVTQPVPLGTSASSMTVPCIPISNAASSETEPPQPRVRGTSNILILCAGPSSNQNNLQAYLQQWGAVVTAYDILDGTHMDITDDTVWGPLLADIRAGKYAGVVASPPAAPSHAYEARLADHPC